MDLFSRLFRLATVDLPDRGKTPADLIAGLETSGQKVSARFSAASESSSNREAIRHMVGLERWAAHRARVALGEPLVIDEMDAYVPAETTPWPELQAAFPAARQETLALARDLIAANALNTPVEHNQFGPMPARAWLTYIRTHSGREQYRVR